MLHIAAREDEHGQLQATKEAEGVHIFLSGSIVCSWSPT